MKNKVSVLLPTYNGERFIKESIQSILSQTFEDFEILVGFNGTVDSSKELVKNIDDKRIKIFDYKNDKGKPKTLNKLLKEASCEIIALQDDDDIWHDKKLELQLKFIEEYDVVGSQIIYIDENGKSPTKFGYGPELRTDNEDISNLMIFHKNNIANSAALIKKQSIIKAGKWNESLPALEDMDLWIRMVKIGCKFKNLNKTLLAHRIHDTSNFNTKEWDLETLLKD